MRRINITVLIGIVMALFTLGKYFLTTDTNEVTGEEQHISLTPEEEIALGMQSAPQMAGEYGGLDPSQPDQTLVKSIGESIISGSVASNTPYQYDFHLLRDPQTVNAFALPGGQIFITRGLYTRLQNKDQLAGVLGHEIGHVVARHSAERISQQMLTQGLTGAAVLASGGYGGGQMAAMVANVMSMSYGREQELESDDLGVRFMAESGLYNPEALIGVMDILEEASGGGSRQPEFASTHPSPENRRARILAAIEKYRR